MSVGVLRIMLGEDISYDEAFEKIDAALYKAKGGGKKTFVIVN